MSIARFIFVVEMKSLVLRERTPTMHFLNIRLVYMKNLFIVGPMIDSS